MPKNGYLTARVDKDLKAKADKVLRRVGVSTTDLITMLLHQVVLKNGVPFDVRIPNAETIKAMHETDAGGGERFDGPTSEIFDKVVKSRK